MEKKTARLYFIDAIRAWAILMMLQGHFIDGLLDTAFRDPNSLAFTIWKYFRGITAPVFFTVSGFIFTYLLIKGDKKGFENPRVKKGIRRGIQLIVIGYLLRLNIFGLFIGQLYDSFFLVDVLHCIGFSLLSIIALYLVTSKSKSYLFPSLLLGITFLLFVFQPWYENADFNILPTFLANYFSQTNGSVFTIIPWLGYTTFGAFFSILFTKFKTANYLYPVAICASFLVGAFLIFYSSNVFLWMSTIVDIQLFESIYLNNYLFIRLGDVLVVFALFMLGQSVLKNATLLKIGQSTLSIYVIHFIILYGSFTGLGIYRFLHHSLSPTLAISGALLFMITCTYLALQFEQHKQALVAQINDTIRFGRTILRSKLYRALRFMRFTKS